MTNSRVFRASAVASLRAMAPILLMIGCSSGSSEGGSGGTSSARGGASGQGGSTSAQGGSNNNAQGGNLSAQGGASTSNGGASASGGSSNSSGGQAAGGSSGGATTNGGSNSSNGGSVSAQGGSSSGGATAMGGTTSSQGGSSAGGKAASGGTSSSGGSSAGGSASGGSSSGGTTSGTGGTTNAGPCDVWVAADGTATAPGTESQPANLLHGYDLLCPPPPSGTANGAACLGNLKTMCLKAGTYVMNTRFELKKTRMGTASRVLTIQAAPNAATRPLLDFSTQPRVACGANPSDGNLGGITMNADYWTIKGIEIKKANDNCIKVQGSHDTVENVVVSECADTGIQISAGSGYAGSGTNNLILNCDSHHNYDPQCNGENADGFGAKEETGASNIFRGCRAWENVDDGYDFYAWLSPIRLENCWSWSNAKTISASEQDGNGFKLGGDSKGGNHTLTNGIAVSNRMRGFTNNSGASSTCTGCRSCSNAQADQGINGTIGTSCPSTAQLAATRGADGSLPAVP